MSEPLCSAVQGSIANAAPGVDEMNHGGRTVRPIPERPHSEHMDHSGGGDLGSEKGSSNQ